jgi:hypothetical protein
MITTRDKELLVLTIYYNKEKTSFQIVKPNESFDGNWHSLVMGITNGNYISYEVK